MVPVVQRSTGADAPLWPTRMRGWQASSHSTGWEPGWGHGVGATAAAVAAAAAAGEGSAFSTMGDGSLRDGAERDGAEQ